MHCFVLAHTLDITQSLMIIFHSTGDWLKSQGKKFVCYLSGAVHIHLAASLPAVTSKQGEKNMDYYRGGCTVHLYHGYIFSRRLSHT